MLWLLAGCRWGIGALLALLIPYATLLLVAPIWEPLVIVLQPIAVRLVEFTTRLIGLQVFVQGNEVMIPAGSFSILDACSGLRYVVAAIVVALLAGELANLSRRSRMGLLIGTVLAAIFLNHLRIVTIICVGYYQGLHHPLMQDHAIVGEIYFAVFVLAPTVLIARMFGNVDGERSKVHRNRGASSAPSTQWPMLSAALLTAVVPLAARAWDSMRLDGVSVAIALPEAIAGETVLAEPLPWNTRFNGAALERSARYLAADGTEVRVYVASFLAENDRQELIGQESGLADVSTNLGFAETGVPTPSVVDARQITDRTGRLWRTWSWYQIGDQVVADRRSGKLQKLKAWFRGASPASVMAIAAPCTATCEETATAMKSFLSGRGVELVHSVTPLTTRRIERDR